MGGHSCVCSNGFIFRRIFSKFGTKMYLGKVYFPRVFGCAALGGPSFIGSKVIWGCYARMYALWGCYARMYALTAAFLDGFPSEI